MRNLNFWSKHFILNFWSIQFLRLLRNEREWFWRKQGRSVGFSSNSEVEATWISLIGWPHKTSSSYGLTVPIYILCLEYSFRNMKPSVSWGSLHFLWPKSSSSKYWVVLSNRGSTWTLSWFPGRINKLLKLFCLAKAGFFCFKFPLNPFRFTSH